MLFFNILITLMFLTSFESKASELKEVIQSRTHGSCETKDLIFSAMKFYKIPTHQKYDSYDVFQRIILFFNDNSLNIRSTYQAQIACQTTSNNEEVCSYKSISDQWLKNSPFDLGELINIPEIGKIELINPDNLNRGFRLTFKEDHPLPHLRGQSFVGGMVYVNFNQNGTNTIHLCQKKDQR